MLGLSKLSCQKNRVFPLYDSPSNHDFSDGCPLGQPIQKKWEDKLTHMASVTPLVHRTQAVDTCLTSNSHVSQRQGRLIDRGDQLSLNVYLGGIQLLRDTGDLNRMPSMGPAVLDLRDKPIA